MGPTGSYSLSQPLGGDHPSGPLKHWLETHHQSESLADRARGEEGVPKPTLCPPCVLSAAVAPPALVVAGYLSGKKGPNQELAFLQAVRGVCEACKGRGLRTLPFSKQAIGEEILVSETEGSGKGREEDPEIMEEDFFDLSETFVEAMATVKKLSQFQPPLGTALRSSILAWAVRLIASGSPGPNQPHHLIQDSAALGNLLVQLAVSLVDPNTGIRAQVRETLGQLHRLLQCQRGLRKKTRGPRWEENPGQPWKEGYLHLRHVGEVFLGHLTQKQKEAFAQAAWGNVSHLAQDWVREGSLVLLYSVLGQAHHLLEEEEEDDFQMSLSALLYKLWKGREAPSEIQALLPKTGKATVSTETRVGKEAGP
uniref:Uncharacterized protein n=1 Tax=Sphaerodactylus townsendi TaxID=933632 RepID=A0ACB8FUL2_9SAUR